MRYRQSVKHAIAVAAALAAASAHAEKSGSNTLMMPIEAPQQSLIAPANVRQPNTHAPSYMLAPPHAQGGLPIASFNPSQDIDLSIGVAGNSISCETADAQCRSALGSIDPEQSVRIDARWRAGSSLAFSVGFQTTGGELLNSGNDLSAAFGAAEDVSLTCELATETWGELELGLRYSRYRQHEGVETLGTDPARAAELGVGWTWGSFRGDLTSRYMEMSDGVSALPTSMLDVNFAWRTPWNASLSVGARNVLDQRAENAIDAQAEELLGRVPYIRYQQDL